MSLDMIERFKESEIAFYIQSKVELENCLATLAKIGFSFPPEHTPSWDKGYIVLDKYLQRLLKGDDNRRTRSALTSQYCVEIVPYEDLMPKYGIRIPETIIQSA